MQRVVFSQKKEELNEKINRFVCTFFVLLCPEQNIIGCIPHSEQFSAFKCETIVKEI